MIKLFALGLLIMCASSCATVKLGVDLLLRELNGDELINNEPQVRYRLQTILYEPENYSMAGFTRKVFSPETKRTPIFYHSFYVVTGKDTSFFTLSFSGTRKTFRSKGAWAIDTASDTASYDSFIHGDNEWDVRMIQSSGGINVEQTLARVIYRIDDNVKYYYNDHKNDIEGMENCNTALTNTYVEN